ncbi:MAG: NAD(P)/FAD-dependent oxidoreductase [Candidatus Aureabacteria bacterium]|jgi:L-2-hydroxyglutarate oxidase LhgO|nr:NAD(P)/FAD-dependent oxidoreductase [Candidatus Auribacterota bacterium]NLW95082.1 NAD(P)/FAD-dependent oxidoreductase [Chlamydiota bacterium]HOE26202.1 NAD(P)/FAD-dependent oxidoreductase [bacterium]HQM52793.1 NAD(P)/FAD-dependent oxidoreductase [bacterium]
MERVDVTIVGAGVVGLAIAAELAEEGLDSAVVERHDSFGRECSSRNSEVVHAGIYYPRGSRKASLCVEGRRELYRLLEERGIPFRKTGKLIVAWDRSQVPTLEKLKAQGDQNGVEGLRLLGRAETAALEPDIRAEAGLLSPETGIFDTHRFMAFLEKKASRRATIAYRCEAVGIAKEPGGYTVRVRDADGEEYRFESRLVVNAAGLGAARVAEMAGIDTAAAGYTISPCKGEYFSLGRGKGRGLRHLIYPPPTDISLGVHTVLDLQGGVKLGPNAFYVNDDSDYAVDEGHRREFFLGAREYLPFIEEEDLSPDMAGIRPKLYRTGEPQRDFVIREEADKGLEGFINLLGLESPALTASLAIGRLVGRMVKAAG